MLARTVRAVVRLPRARWSSTLTHITPDNKPCMVSVVGKAKSYRVAIAESTIVLPAVVMDALNADGGDELRGKKVRWCAPASCVRVESELGATG